MEYEQQLAPALVEIANRQAEFEQYMD